MIWKCEDGHDTAIIIADDEQAAITAFATARDVGEGTVTCYPLGIALSSVLNATYFVEKDRS